MMADSFLTIILRQREDMGRCSFWDWSGAIRAAHDGSSAGIPSSQPAIEVVLLDTRETHGAERRRGDKV